jgi:hypothetical protein
VSWRTDRSGDSLTVRNATLSEDDDEANRDNDGGPNAPSRDTTSLHKAQREFPIPYRHGPMVAQRLELGSHPNCERLRTRCPFTNASHPLSRKCRAATIAIVAVPAYGGSREERTP